MLVPLTISVWPFNTTLKKCIKRSGQKQLQIKFQAGGRHQKFLASLQGSLHNVGQGTHIFYRFFSQKFNFIHFIIPFGKSGSPCLGVRLQQLQEQCYPVLQVRAGSFHVFCNPPNSDMDYRIFITLTCICDHSYACVYTQGLVTPTSQHIFD